MVKSFSGQKIFLLIITVILTGFIAACRAEQETAEEKPISVTSTDSIISKFQKPDVDARVMARMWFPDAGAGADKEGLALVAKQIKDLARAGFGGVEIAFLSDSTSYGNDDARTIGWGSGNWKRILKEALRTANSIENGFKIDITITSHWPPIVNNIDPNDDEASQEMTFAYKKITAKDLASGTLDLPLPERRTKDYFSPMGGKGDSAADFLFVEKYIAATIAKVMKFDEKGIPVFELSSLTDVSNSTANKVLSIEQISERVSYKEIDGVKYAGYAGGIPDRTYAVSHGLDYEKDIIEKFGPDPANDNFTGKIDAENARRRMADWQFLYETRLDNVEILTGYKPSIGNSLAIGDCVLMGTYYRGTGQVMSGGTSITVYNRSYATDYFSDSGIGKVIEFWDRNILDDDMMELLKENGTKNGTSIFEDSIEIHNEKPLWTYDLLDKFREYQGYDATRYVPVFAMQPKVLMVPPGFPPADQTPSGPSFDEQESAERIIEDYNLLLGSLYAEEHASVISRWASKFNYTYRAQGYSLVGLDIAGAAAALDIPEGDNSSTGDGVRNLVAAVNVKGGKMLSMESTTFSASLNSTWAEVAKELNRDFSIGVNRSILHGSAFARTFNRYNSEWPGWNFWNFSSWNSRQIYWDDVDTFSNYVARNQALLQNGKPQVDLAILLGTETSFSMQSGNSMQALLDNGYSYNLLSEALLKLENAVVESGVLCPDGPAYKALIIREAKILSSKAVQTLIEYSKHGLPIILYNCDIKRVYGTNNDDNNDKLLAESMAELVQMDNVKSAETQGEILDILADWGINPAASYTAPGLEVSHRSAPEGNYYYFYNNNRGSNIKSTVSLMGRGNPYRLDAWTGEIFPIAIYSVATNRFNVEIELKPGESKIIAISEDTAQFPEVKNVYVTGTSSGEILYERGSMVHHAEAPGKCIVTLSDSTKKIVTIDNVPEAINLSEGWSLKVESWGPDPDANKVDPTISSKKIISFENIPLLAWAELPATGKQLEKLGVGSMKNVSGIGHYSKTFLLPPDWNTNLSAYMSFDHGADMIVEVTINDNSTGDINQLSNTLDAGRYLKAGINSLGIKLDTTLKNRKNFENPGNGLPGPDGGGPFPPGPPPSGDGPGTSEENPPPGGPGGGMEAPPGRDMGPAEYGLTGVKVVPYVSTTLIP